MKLAELFEAGGTKGYDISEKNRVYFDDYDEWLSTVRKDGGDVGGETDSGVIRAIGYDGIFGEFDKKKNTGWLVSSFKLVKVSKASKIVEGKFVVKSNGA